MTTKKESSYTQDGPTVRGVHDIANHPAIAKGVFRNVGDSVYGRDAAGGKRPVLAEAQSPKQKSEG